MISQKTFQDRRELVRRKLAEFNVQLAIVTPGENLRYLTNYQALALERITALVISQTNSWLLVPALEYHTALEKCSDIEIVSWDETTNPYQLITKFGPTVTNIMIDENMPYFHVEKIQDEMRANYLNFAQLIAPIRRRKEEFEINQLREVSQSINRVHQQLVEIPFLNRSEKAIARDISELILDEHEKVDFIIVASGPNSANPHHKPGERIVQSKDVVLIDIGGTSAAGYCSDCSRTYVVKEAAQDFMRDFSVLKQAQQMGVERARAGMTGEEMDQLVRGELAKAQLAEWFIHRLGHGIGMQTHEAPYLIQGNQQPLEVGNVFSVEPGFYLPGTWGARIEDIVALTQKGAENFNNFDHDLRILN